LGLVYDVSHNTCKEETHIVSGTKRRLFVHRKGATRAFGPHHPEIPAKYQAVGQPVFIGGSMGTESYVLSGHPENKGFAFSSACHGAGRAMSRTQARKKWQGQALIEDLKKSGIFIRSSSFRGIAEEAPLAYKNVREVIDTASHAKLANKVCCLKPLICVKG
ncbi:MAG TPA: RtcB family protein, partial [Gammaproteobacteria bacterium]|nr:RtcB family protein [Gammaproteobacteria bacterium]